MRTSLARPRYGLSAALLSPVFALLLITGCGGGSSSGSGGSGGGGGTTAKTTVAIQISSKANDQLSQYTLSIQSIALANSSGSVTIFNNPVNLDFIAPNGNDYPVAIVQVPQGTYTSATVSVAGAAFAHTYSSGSGPANERYVLSNNPSTATVTLPSPINISGTAMGLNLSLDVSASISLNNPLGTNSNTTGTPNITITGFGVSAESTTPANGKCIGLYGQITAVSSSSITATLGATGAVQQQNAGLQPGQSITAALNSSTAYQPSGVTNSTLKNGQLANFDLVLEPDGSYAVSRIEVDDSSAADLTVGMLSSVNPTVNTFQQFPTVYEGANLTGSTGTIGNTTAFYISFNSSSAKFQVSPSINVSSLPFTFSASTMAPGQNVAVGANSYPSNGNATATSITLMPQTIDAKVTAGPVTNGSYAVWTVTLAPYDPILQVNTSPGVTGLQLGGGAGTVQVYVGSSTAKLGSSTLATGGTFRFHGLLFDNAGTLVLVADQYNDGVNF